MYKTLILDLDGTLLNTDKTISNKNKNAIKKCIDAGVNVSLASGRPPTDIYHYIEELDLYSFYHIADNGASIFKYHGDIIRDYKFGNTTYKKILAKLRNNKIEYGLLDTSAKYYIHEYATIFGQIMNTMPNTKTVKMTKEEINKLSNVYKISACCKNNYDYKIIEEIKNEIGVDAFIVGKMFVDIMPKGVNKFTGVKMLEKQTGILTDEMIAMGDYENDKDNLKNIGLGICMKNGLDSVKEVSDIILNKTNDEDAVAYVIEKYILRSV